MKTFSLNHCFYFWLMSLTLWPKVIAITVGFSRPCAPHASGISAMLSIVAFLLGKKLVHVQVVPGSSIDCPLLVLRKTSGNLSGEIPLPQRLFGNSRRMGLTNYYCLKVLKSLLFGVFSLWINCEITLRVG